MPQILFSKKSSDRTSFWGRLILLVLGGCCLGMVMIYLGEHEKAPEKSADIEFSLGGKGKISIVLEKGYEHYKDPMYVLTEAFVMATVQALAKFEETGQKEWIDLLQDRILGGLNKEQIERHLTKTLPTKKLPRPSEKD